MNITVKIIPHSRQRYDTVGDWWVDDEGTLQIRVSDMGDMEYQNAIALHEQVEALLCIDDNISEKLVTKFDIEYENTRKDGDVSEPGDDPSAPYHIQHGYATAVERMYLAACGKNWRQYENRVLEL